MGNFARRTGKRKEKRGEVVATGLIEIDAVEIFGFLSGSYSPLREREKGGADRRERELLTKVTCWECL